MNTQKSSGAHARDLPAGVDSAALPQANANHDAADAFLARLERVDAGTLDITQLLEDFQSPLPHEARRNGAAAKLDDYTTTNGSTSKVRSSANGASTFAPATTRRDTSTLISAPSARTSERAEPVVTSEESRDRSGNGLRLAVLGIGVVVIAGTVMIGLRRSTPADAPSASAGATAPGASTTPARKEEPAVHPPDISSESATSAADLESRVRGLVGSARQHLASGQRSEAADAIAEGLALRSTDSEVQAAARQLLTDTRQAYERARRDARAVNATGTPRYVEAERLVRDVSRRRGVAPLDTARSYESALAAMNASADDARKAADAKAALTTAPPASSPAVAVNAPAAVPTARAADVSAPAQSTPVVVTAPATAPQRTEAVTPPVGSAVTPSPREVAPPARDAVPVQSSAPPATTAQSVASVREVAPARATVSDEQSIRAVVQAYVDAYSRLDANAVRGVYPATDVAGLQRSFARMRSQRVEIVNERIQINGGTATVTCIWQAVFELSAGAPNRSAPQTTLTLQRSGDTWLIVGRR